MNVGPYFRMIAEHRFRMHPLKWPMFVLGTGVSVLNSALSLLQSAFFAQKIAETTLVAPPIFIIGHWRSGTTLMHELLTLDPQFSFPNNFDVFTPNHLLVSRPLLYPLINLLLPGKRPMDGMPLGAKFPQEDDFALISLNAPTMYREIAFPNERFQKNSGTSEPDQEQNVAALDRFCKVLTIRYGKRLIHKSPPHTERIRFLLKAFPQAKFVHISRHPYQIVPSTMKLWRALDATQGFQLPRYSDEQLRAFINARQGEMYRHYFQDRNLLSPSQLVEIRFEDLLDDPVTLTRKIYETFALDDFESISDGIRKYFSERREITPSKTELPRADRLEISRHWREYMERYGYPLDHE